jgi:hypothetical protein
MASDVARLIVHDARVQTEKDVRKRSDTFKIYVNERLHAGNIIEVATHAIEFCFVPPYTTRVTIVSTNSKFEEKRNKPLYVDRSAEIG